MISIVRSGTGTILTGEVKMYVDGVEIVGTELNYGTAQLVNMFPVYIGGPAPFTSTSDMADIRAFSQAKDATFIEQLYEATKGFYLG